MESEQDRKTYRESGKNTGISLGYDISSGKVSGFASTGKSHTDSDYESVTDQAGIYAGDKGFDITVKDNTYLKGAVIDSKGDAEKNTLRTGTLSWEDVENKAGYESGGMGISYAPKDSITPLNARGLTPQMSPTVKDKAGSATKAAIAKGTIVITDKKNQKQDISTLNRDTQNSLNKLKEIFDKSKVEEKQELIQKVSQLGNEAIHAVSDHYGWKEGSSEKMLLHGALGALIGSMSGGSSLSGALSGSVNEFAMGYLEKIKGKEWVEKHPDVVQAVSMALGAAVGEIAGEESAGAYTAQMGTKWNEELSDQILHNIEIAQQNISDKAMNEARYLVNNGYIDPKNMIGDYYTVQLSVGEGIKLESGVVIIDKEGNVYGMVTLGLGGSISAEPFTIGVGFLLNKQNGYISAITGWSGNINAIGLIGGRWDSWNFPIRHFGGIRHWWCSRDFWHGRIYLVCRECI